MCTKNFLKGYTLTRDLPGNWHGSDAEAFLKQDVKEGRHLTSRPKELFTTRTEYKEFEYQNFRKHVHQEARSAKEAPYWMRQKEKKEKKNKKLKEAIAKVLEEQNTEFENAFARLRI